MSQPSLPVSRRVFLKTTAGAAGTIVLGFFVSSAQAAAGAGSSSPAVELPVGSAPAALSLAHFPDRLHAFVWRNWSLVPLKRIARVVGAKPADIFRLGRAMGLAGPPRISADQQRRSYLTVIKRNWHLLPYGQLLELLGWTAEQLAYTLREDDFLYVKLGNLKPRCEPLRYRPPDAAAQRREGEIARAIHAELGSLTTPREPLFSFVTALTKPPRGGTRVAPAGNLKFCYSYFALYGDPLLDTKADPHPEGYLARLAEAGVSGVWLQAVLYKLAPFPWDPRLSSGYEIRLANLSSLVSRARKHGIRVLLYLNEPRSMPLRFFAAYPQLKGVTEGDHAALCTSQVPVQQFLTESVARICRAVPELGGFFTITASENLTNCWSHGQGAKCPACAQRGPAETIAGVNRLFFEGIRQAGTKAELLAWDWGWNDAWAPEAIAKLPSGVGLQSVSEWSLTINRGGVATEVGEYSISAVGPGPRAEKHWRLARERGLRTFAKIQAGNTWELSSVPYIPAVENVARHAENLRGARVDGLMLGWTLGGYPSPNLEVVSEALKGAPAPDAMRRVAERRFGPVLAPAVVSAWHEFSLAFSEFPYHGGTLYSGPQQLGPANLLWPEPTGYQASMVGFPYDDLEAWRSVYPAHVFIQQFEKVAEGFFNALERLKAEAGRAEGSLSKAQREAFEAECRVAEASAIHFRSSANQARFVVTRRQLAAGIVKADPAVRAELERLIRDELRLARRLYQLQCSDSRLGFEASNHYFYVPLDLAEKILNCRDLLERWLSLPK
ncbi:MAG TPA: hypothetical protein VJA21_22440 [Verrucomicrobiae bacterium]